ncbi:RteC domain-containing protein [Alistipes senegalensis]|uniref:RteC domain-containing protein n=2 Tax=Alistipes senegalensis TaxID=1288121 RepID=A0ABY5V532_9BACT|nr:RteC domain-containing protein [Alistipes senegalensis]UEA87740.1 RteC domain-containing protein [Alistipes senegalensis]UWN64670.1 RteC domain-containing protein [Alistipes senegalensis JC50]
MTHYITADHLVDTATKAVTEELFREFDKALQSFCNEEQDRIVVFRTLRYTRIRLYVLRKYLSDDEAATRNTQSRFLEIALGYINTELELLTRYGGRAETPAMRMRWTGTLVEMVELIYGLQEMRCIDDGDTPINELFAFFGSQFGLEIKVRNCYDTYLDIKRRKNDSRTYFLDKMRDRLNLRMQRDDEKEMKRRR